MPYAVFLGLLGLFTWLYYRDRRFETLYLFLTFILLAGFSGLRAWVGTDYPVYENAYLDTECESFLAFEMLWQWLILAMRWLGLSFHSFLLLVSSITIALMLYGMRRLCAEYPLGVLFYVITSVGYLETMNTIRQSLAIMIVFAAFHLFVDRRYRQFFLWVLLSCFVHRPSVIWFVLLPLLFIRWDWRVLAGGMAVALLAGSVVLEPAAKLITPFLSDRYALYLTQEFKDAHQGVPTVVFQNAAAILMLWGSSFVRGPEQRVTRLTVTLSAFAMIIYNMTLSYEVAMRFMFPPVMMMCAAWPNLLAGVRDKWFRLGVVLVYIGYLIFTINNVMTPGGPLSEYRWLYDYYYYTPDLW